MHQQIHKKQENLKPIKECIYAFDDIDGANGFDGLSGLADCEDFFPNVTKVFNVNLLRFQTQSFHGFLVNLVFVALTVEDGVNGCFIVIFIF